MTPVALVHACARGGHRAARVLVVLVMLAAVVVSTLPAGAASSSAVVGASVPSVVSLDTTGCRSESTLALGAMPVSSFVVGDACTLSFGSSNDTARLRAWQRDEMGSALETTAANWTPLRGSAYWFGLAVSSPGIAWIGGWGGPGESSVRLEHTTDGGATWTSQTTCDGGTPWDIAAISDTELYMTTGNSICHTVDGGANWTSVFNGGSVSSIEMLNATTGWAVGGNRILATTDGTNWNTVYTDGLFTNMGAISATPTGTIVVPGTRSSLTDTDRGAVFSADGGATWTRSVLINSPGRDTSGVMGALALNDSILLVTASGYSFRSADGGATWASNGAYVSGEPFVRSDGVIFGSNGGDRIVRSNDDGATWISVPLGTGASAHNTGVAGSGLSELWVGGFNDRRMRSVDGGTTWASQSATKPSYNAALTWDDQTWMVAGTAGENLRTVDGGTTLAPTVIGTTSNIYDGLVVPAFDVAIIVGDDAIRRSTDQGATWTAIASPSPGTSWFAVTIDDDEVLWAVGGNGRVMSSSDLGRTWKLETTVPGTPWLRSISVWRGQVWVGGWNAGEIWRSSVGSPQTWASVPTGRSGEVLGLWAIDATTAVALTSWEFAPDQSFFSRTTDGGSTWTSVGTEYSWARSLTVDDSHRTAMAASNNWYQASHDRGMTWETARTVGVGQYINRMKSLGGGRLVAVGDGGLVSASEPAESVPDGMGGAGSGFGACLETAAGTAVNDWSLQGLGGCVPAAPAAAWQSIAQTSAGPTASIATTASTATGVVGLRFGLRTSSVQRSGGYVAGIVFEAIAPV